MSTISASTTSTTAYKVTADTTGTLVFQTGATPTTALTIGSDQSVTFAGAVSSSGNQTVTGNLTVNGNTTLGDASTDTVLMTGAPSIGGAGYGMGMGFRNRIINGAMVIDQRNAGAAVSTNGAYPVDRFQMALTSAIGSTFTAQQSSTAATGFTKSFVWTVGTAGTATGTQSARFDQQVEGYNIADFGLGASGAASFTLSFWVRSSVTGTYCVYFSNSALDRSYVAQYTISASNTWEQKTITVSGDTSGTWLKDNGSGLRVGWDLGSGSDRNTTANSWASGFYTRTSSQTNFIGNAGATFYITGVQLEKGSTATSFDYRPYGTELALCQRYYQTFVEMIGQASGTTTMQLGIALQNEMRSTPSISATGACSFQDGVTAFTQSSFSYLNQGGSSKGINGYLGNFTGLTQFRMYQRNPTFGILTASAEL